MRCRARLVWLFLAAGAAAPAVAEQPQMLGLASGEQAAIVLEAGTMRVLSRHRAPPLSAFLQDSVRAYEDGTWDAAVGAVSAPVTNEDIPAEPPPIARDQIQISLLPVSGGTRTLLYIENGYDQALTYRARIRRDGREAPTDVCQVLPDLRSAEWWPYPIESIALSDLRLEPWKEGQEPHCG